MRVLQARTEGAGRQAADRRRARDTAARQSPLRHRALEDSGTAVGSHGGHRLAGGPAIDAPWTHGEKDTTFTGDYFGLAPAGLGWDLVRTDTRTGIQELFFSRVQIEATTVQVPDWVVDVLVGVTQGGDGIVWVPGRGPVPVPPNGPVREAMIGSMIGELAKRLPRGKERDSIGAAAKELTSGVRRR
jgi:hypothetical protein